MELTKRNIQLQEKVNAAGKGKILFFFALAYSWFIWIPQSLTSRFPTCKRTLR